MAALNRRAFMQAAAATTAAVLATKPARAIEPIARKGGAQLKLSLAAYSFRDHFNGKLEPAMTLEDFVDFAAEMELGAIEATAYYFTDTSPEYLAKFRGRCTRQGLDISGGAIGNNFCLMDDDKRKAELAKAKQWIDRYALLGAKTIRIFAGKVEKGDTEAAARERCIVAIQEACDHAGKHGIYLALENHGGITDRPEQMLAMVKAVKHDWFGVNLDTGNFHGDDPYADLAQLAPFAVTVQVKTEIQVKGKEKEVADYAKIVEILTKGKYRGYVALEYEGKEEPLKAVPKQLALLRKTLQIAN